MPSSPMTKTGRGTAADRCVGSLPVSWASACAVRATVSHGSAAHGSSEVSTAAVGIGVGVGAAAPAACVATVPDHVESVELAAAPPASSSARTHSQ
eukprot:4151879-Lingulodinium_polyedra.AAC.1